MKPWFSLYVHSDMFNIYVCMHGRYANTYIYIHYIYIYIIGHRYMITIVVDFLACCELYPRFQVVPY